MDAHEHHVISERFGLGTVLADRGATLVVRFDHGIEECERAALRIVDAPLQAIARPVWHPPLEVITRLQAEAIRSVSDAWSVFSRSRIALLPHQLWVCRQVLQTWPTRWLVADDVGLGKTIEAGLILSPLLSRGDVKRLLVLCPASLVEQWQFRMRTMFDVRLARYSEEADTSKADFWGLHQHVVASLQTLRKDSRGRHERLLAAEPWDLVLVDEAHHLNADEERGPTLGYKLVARLNEEKRVRSMVFFTGTPHRGKNFGFLSLLALLRPDLFDPRHPLQRQLPQLGQVLIRTNEQNVTDLKGQRLFQAPRVTPEEYHYSPPEQRFYDMLTEFIATGKAYASTLSSNDGRAVMLVLFAMQKLASSSVAAILRALRGRLARTSTDRKKLDKLRTEYEELENSVDLDRLAQLEEEIVQLDAKLQLMADEEPRLRELVSTAEAVSDETKIGKILNLLEGPFFGRPVVFFTEYKATQSLLMSALISRFGDGCVTFINGDERAEGVLDSNGIGRSFVEPRESAADRFNAGLVRFLVSTEAGGEGIDLQENCHSLIHVDLPWNPMRLHQRVGRLNRYGQTRQVEVFTIRNPETVESHIWDKLNGKIENIMRAVGQAMEEPEDLLQLVLGMTSPTLFRELFTEAESVPAEKLSVWFDQKTARFGGQDVIETVRDLVGHCGRFDFQEVSAQIPQVNLPDLRLFFSATLEINRRKVQDDQGRLSFKTPETWFKSDPSIRASYQGLVFDRDYRGKDAAQQVLGVGHKLMDLAIEEARHRAVSVTALAPDALEHSIYVFRITDRVTAVGGTVRSVVLGVEAQASGDLAVLLDWRLLRRLNQIIEHRSARRRTSATCDAATDQVNARVTEALHVVEKQLPNLDLSFKVPTIGLLAVLWSGTRGTADIVQAPDGEVPIPLE